MLLSTQQAISYDGLPPAITPATGTYTADQTVTITCPTAGATIRYTTDGSVPTDVLGTIYTVPFVVSATTTVKAVAYTDGVAGNSPAVYSAITLKVGQPALSVPAGTYSSAQNVVINSVTPGTTIRYTLDGSAPSLVNGSTYTAPISISSTTTLRTIGFKAGYTDSNPITSIYTFVGATAGTPTFSPVSGVYTTNQSVTIASAPAGMTIRYTTNGATPTQTVGTLYTAPVNVATTTVIKAIAYKAGTHGQSAVANSGYTLKVGQPSFSPPQGTYSSAQNVTLSSVTPGASFRYTLDGSAPSDTVGILYAGPFAVNSTTTVRAVGFKAGYVNSNIISSTYTFVANTAATPTFSPVAGVYTNNTALTISTASAGATIRYTVNGAAPTQTSGTIYTAPVSLAATSTIRAIAYGAGTLGQSGVATAGYTLKVGQPVFSPSSSTFSTPQNITLSTATTGAAMRYTTDGSTPSSTNGIVYTGPIAVNSTVTIRAIGYKAGYTNSNITSATYTYVANTAGTPVFSPPAGTYTTATNVSIASAPAGMTIRYTLDGSTPTQSTGLVYTAPINVDATTTIKAIAYKTGVYGQSALATAVYTMKAGQPIITPASGTYVTSATVSITSSTVGAQIFYTNDGSVPTIINGTLYTAPFAVNSSQTITARAFRNGYTDSNVSTANYVIRVAAPVFTPPWGSYAEPQAVSIVSATPDAVVRYTMDGSIPSETVGTIYATPINVDSTRVIRAIAYKPGLASSAVYSASYTIGIPNHVEPTTGMQFVWVPSGTFTMGDEHGDGYIDETPTHDVTLTNGFFMGKYEVTQDQWAAITGSNPSTFQGGNLPVETVDWRSVRKFVIDLNAATEGNYDLPTEAQWEYAAKGGHLSGNFKYAGTSANADLGNYAWYYANSAGTTHPVGTKLPNELGLYDMSGNVWEYTKDWYGPYAAGALVDPEGPAEQAASGEGKVLRGVGYSFQNYMPRVAARGFDYYPFDMGYDNVGLRLVMNPIVAKPKFSPAPGSYLGPQSVSITTSTAGAQIRYTLDGTEPTSSTGTLYTGPVGVSSNTVIKAIAYKPGVPDSVIGVGNYNFLYSSIFTGPLAGMSFSYVPGGSFVMGDDFGIGNASEQPPHTVSITNGFFMGRHEVTLGQWSAVMGSYPAGNTGAPNLPVYGVTWTDAQAFVTALNTLTGMNFRLPTEAEWEYAAKGGPFSQGYIYAGTSSDALVGDYAWYDANSVNPINPVGTKLPNELDLYDMSGNALEWVADYFGPYAAGSLTDPTGPVSGTFRVIKSVDMNSPYYLRTSNRMEGNPSSQSAGLRLVLEL